MLARWLDRRVLGPAVLLATALTVGNAAPVQAHALLRSSSPPAGAVLPQSPRVVTITFTEPPDPRLSTLRVLDQHGRQVAAGPTRPVAGQPLELEIPLRRLPPGIYTVSWQTVSASDGHVAEGAFAFGVRTSPAAVVTPPEAEQVQAMSAPGLLGVGARWGYDLGLGLLLGGAWLAVTGMSLGGLLGLASVGGGAALLGLLGMGEAEREAASVSWAKLDATQLGHSLQLQLAPVLAAVVLIAFAWLLQGRGRQLCLMAAAPPTGAAIFIHVLEGHAASQPLPWLQVGAAWIHMVASAVWMGGLGGLLVAIRGRVPHHQQHLVRLFSRVAGVALAVIATSGLIRALTDLGQPSQVVATLFGRLVLLKTAILGGIVLLGAVQRYRNLPLLRERLPALRRVGGAELTLAIGALAAAALMSSLPPPSFVSASSLRPAASPGITVSGSDYGTTVKARLQVTPGTPGPNRFTLWLQDYDTGAPVKASVALGFTLPDHPEVGESTLGLTASGPGRYQATGTNLSLVGDWQVTVEVQRGSDSVEVPLSLRIGGSGGRRT
ncbi:MAG TPA: copper resistance protein CopC [Candidatus Dormibacteraeota bacterium]|nr:copper resistance protein CopC [Candidatus Dormibacteraeota bacterium]